MGEYRKVDTKGPCVSVTDQRASYGFSILRKVGGNAKEMHIRHEQLLSATSFSIFF